MTPRTHYYGPASSVVWVILFFSLCKLTNTGRTLLENRPASLHSFLWVRWSHYSTLLFMERSVMVLWELFTHGWDERLKGWVCVRDSLWLLTELLPSELWELLFGVTQKVMNICWGISVVESCKRFTVNSSDPREHQWTFDQSTRVLNFKL